MKRLRLLAMAASLIALVPALGGLTPHSPVFISSDAAAPIVVNSGEEFFIALASNASTGYAWTSTVSDEKPIAYEGNVYQNAPTGAMGAPGQQIFIFHANRSGSATIAFSYARPSDQTSTPAKTLTFNVTVR